MNVRHQGRTLSLTVAALLMLGVSPLLGLRSAPNGDEYGTFLMLVGETGASFEETVAGVERGLESSDWELLAAFDAGVDRDACEYRARVFVVHAPGYAEQVLGYGSAAAFALPLRLAVFEDEDGVHIVAANPQSLNRTIVAEEGFEAQSAAIVESLVAMLELEFPGKVGVAQYGQMRDRGLISKTMGIMAGGPFTGKVESVLSVKFEGDEGVAGVAARIYEGLEQVADEWGKWEIRPIYLLDLPESDLSIIGVTGEAMEVKSFQIIGAGPNEAREDFACPGIDHAPAYPIELVIVREDDKAKILIADTMFRMKMYFEEAGKMKFAMNMKMPGSIEDEIRDKVEEALY